MKQQGSAIWGGATIGLFLGLILGFFIGSSYWKTALCAVIIGAVLGIVANFLAFLGGRTNKQKTPRD